MRQTTVDLATLDFWDDNADVYGVHPRAGQQIVVTLDARRRRHRSSLWKPGTQVQAAAPRCSAARRARGKPGTRERSCTARRQRAGTTSRSKVVQPGAGVYRLR